MRVPRISFSSGPTQRSLPPAGRRCHIAMKRWRTQGPGRRKFHGMIAGVSLVTCRFEMLVDVEARVIRCPAASKLSDDDCPGLHCCHNCSHSGFGHQSRHIHGGDVLSMQPARHHNQRLTGVASFSSQGVFRARGSGVVPDLSKTRIQPVTANQGFALKSQPPHRQEA